MGPSSWSYRTHRWQLVMFSAQHSSRVPMFYEFLIILLHWQPKAVILGLCNPVEVPVSTRHDTGTGMKYGTDKTLFNRTRKDGERWRLGFPFLFFLFFFSLSLHFLVSQFCSSEERRRSDNVVTQEEEVSVGRAAVAERRKRIEERESEWKTMTF